MNINWTRIAIRIEWAWLSFLEWVSRDPVRAATLMLFTAALFAVLIAVSTPARAAIQLDQRGCLELAIWSRDVIWARDMGADKDKVRASVEEMGRDEPSGVFVIVLRQFDALWGTEVPRRAVAQMQYDECARLRGQYGDAV